MPLTEKDLGLRFDGMMNEEGGAQRRHRVLVMRDGIMVAKYDPPEADIPCDVEWHDPENETDLTWLTLKYFS